MIDMKTNEAELSRFESFVTERHRIWLHRMNGDTQPWTTDTIMQSASFCNVFRVLDRGSQQMVHFLWTDEGLSLSPLRTLILCMLYRRTNGTDGWREAVELLGLPNVDVADDNIGALIASTQAWLAAARSRGLPIVDSRPYSVCNGAAAGKTLVESLSDDMEHALISGVLDRTAKLLDHCNTEEHLTALTNMCSLKRLGPFLAQQILTDFGYSQWGSAWYENQVIVAGPGSRRGLARITNDDVFVRSASEQYCAEIIEWIRQRVISATAVRLDLEYTERRPSLMDIQNCLCEFDKYDRYTQNPDRRFRQYIQHTKGALHPVYPRIWN